MSLLKATWALYKDSAVDAAKGLGRSMFAVLALALAFVVLAVVGALVGGFGMAGGFIMGLVEVVVIGWYLSLVEVGVVANRRVTFSDLRQNVGRYFWEVISILFIFWIGELVLGMAAPAVLLVAVPVCVLLFNPVPEMIYQERTQSMALLSDSLRFMQENWPEWLGAQLLAGVFLGGWAWLVFGGRPDPAMILKLVQVFGPWFGFIQVGSYALASLAVGGFIGAVVILAFTHFFMLFRGHLYRRLRHSSRRGRAWQSRMR